MNLLDLVEIDLLKLCLFALYLQWTLSVQPLVSFSLAFGRPRCVVEVAAQSGSQSVGITTNFMLANLYITFSISWDQLKATEKPHNFFLLL